MKDLTINVYLTGTGGTKETNWTGSFKCPSQGEIMDNVLVNVLNGIRITGAGTGIYFEKEIPLHIEAHEVMPGTGQIP